MKTSRKFVASLAILCLGSLGCQKHLPQEGLWRGTLDLPEGRQLPFQMYLDLNGAAPAGYFVNGPERTPIPEIYHRNDSLIFVFSEYGAAMGGAWKSGKLMGHFLRFRKDTTAMTFQASPIAAAPVAATTTPKTELPLVGKFVVYLRNKDMIDSSMSATFWARGDSVFGTFIAADGDLGLMAGSWSDDRLQLSRFTGWQANMLDLRRDHGHWWGKYFVRNGTPMPFSLEPVVSLPKASRGTAHTIMKNPRKPFEFSGLTVTGDTLRSADPRLKGKVLLLDIMGTWCHNCMDEAPLLQQLYSEFGDQGLEVIGLSFELSNDFVTARKNLLLYQERYGITFPVLFCGTTEAANVQARLGSQVANFFAYPTSIFVDRRGIVQAIHEGFKGPGTGEEYQQQVQEYYDAVKKLMKARIAAR
jgi:thiol-disulfide isomerase/thioredoxin